MNLIVVNIAKFFRLTIILDLFLSISVANS